MKNDRRLLHETPHQCLGCRGLGLVDKVWQPYFCGDQGEEAIERFLGLVVSGSNTTELLDPIEHPLDAVSILVGSEVPDGRGFPVCLRRHDLAQTISKAELAAALRAAREWMTMH